jgi:PAS domain S-box-containing protein
LAVAQSTTAALIGDKHEQMAIPIRILILEDQVADEQLILYEMRRAGYDPDWTRVDNEADYLTSLTPELDIILSDYSMPQFDALMALNLLQTHGLDIPFIVVTGTISEEVAVECMKRGATDYLIKDRLARLGAAVARALGEKQLREEKRAADEQLSYQANLLQNVSDAVISTDLNYIVQSWNKAAEIIYGWSELEAIGRKSEDLFHTENLDADTEARMVEKFLKAGGWWGEVTHQRRDGTKIIVFASITLLRDSSGNPIGLVASNRDITESKRAEAALRESEEKFGAVFRESLDMIVILDAGTGDILSANRASHRILGYDHQGLVGQHVSLLFPPNAPLSSAEFLGKLRAYSWILASQEFRRADGSNCPMDVTATLIPWGDSQAIIATFRDVTERQRMEQERVEKEILRIALLKEQELGELRSRFMSTVSHEFRTPLAMILTSSELLERYYDKLPPERRESSFATIRQQVRHLGDMLDDVSIIVKAQMGRLEFNPIPLNVEQFCLRLVDELQATIGSGHHLDFVSHPPIPNAFVDERLLQHILRNLLSNAIKYSPQGEKIYLDLYRRDEDLIFQVRDHGIGIPVADQERLFEPYHRATNVGTISGTGLGLRIVKDCAELHGGNVMFASEEGKGTTFTIRLPIRSMPLDDESTLEG